MTQPTAAARRFYHAFYRWNLLLLSSNGRSLQHLPRPQLSASKFRLNRSYSSQESRPGFDESQRWTSNVEDASRSPASPSEPSGPRKYPKKWLTDPPVSSNDRPFDTFGVWEEVVRYRSSAGVMIQMAVPTEQIQVLQRVYGTKLEQLVPRSFWKSPNPSTATVELGENVVVTYKRRRNRGVGVSLRSVLISGSLEEAGKLKTILRDRETNLARARSMERQQQPSPSAKKPAVMDKPAWGLVTRRPLAQVNSTQPQNSAQSPAPDSKAMPQKAPPPALSRSYEKQTTPSWLLTPPKHSDDFPTPTLRLLSPTLRRRAADNSTITVEVVIPANEYWDAEVMNLLQQHRPGVQIELLDAFSSALRTGEIRWRRAIVAKGDVEAARKAVDEILQTPNKVLKLVDPESIAIAIEPTRVAKSSFSDLDDESATESALKNPVVESGRVDSKGQIHSNRGEAKSVTRSSPARNSSNSSSPIATSAIRKVLPESQEEGPGRDQPSRAVFAIPADVVKHVVSKEVRFRREIPETTFEFDVPNEDHFRSPTGFSTINERFVAVHAPYPQNLFAVWHHLRRTVVEAIAMNGKEMDVTPWPLVRIVEDKMEVFNVHKTAKSQFRLSQYDLVAMSAEQRTSVLSDWAKYWRDSECVVYPVAIDGKPFVRIRGYRVENVERVKSWILQVANETTETHTGRLPEGEVSSEVGVEPAARTDQVSNKQTIEIEGVDLTAEEKALGYTMWVRLAVPAQAIDHILTKSDEIWKSEKCLVKKVNGFELSEPVDKGYLTVLGPLEPNIGRATATIRDLVHEATDGAIATNIAAEVDGSARTSLYSRFSVPIGMAPYMMSQARWLLRRGKCVLQADPPSNHEQSGEQCFTLWGYNQAQLDRAKAYAKRVLSDKLRLDGDNRDAATLITVLEEGFEPYGMSQMRSVRNAVVEDCMRNIDLPAYAVFTIPGEALDRLLAVNLRILRRKCVLQVNEAAEQPEGVKPVEPGRTRVTLWGIAEEDVKAGMKYVKGIVQTSLERDGLAKVGEVGVTVLEEGLSDTPYRYVETSKPKVRDGASDAEQSDSASAVSHDDDTSFRPLHQGISSSPAVDETDAYFEEAEQLGDQPSHFEQGGSAATSATPETEDDILFPEFSSQLNSLQYPEPLHARPASNTKPHTRSRPSLAVNNPRHEWGLQQRAYSTRTISKRSQHSVSSETGNADKITNVSEDLEIDESAISSEQLAEDLKRTLRTLTHPVVLITSRVSEPAGGATNTPTDDPLRGVTVSSLNTITLSPTPIVSFNLRVPSRSWDAIESSGRFAAYFLAATPEGAVIAHAFTQPYERSEEPFLRLMRLGVRVFGDSSDQTRPPLLHWPHAIIARMTASVLPDKCVHVGDHVVVIAEVKGVSLPAKDEKRTSKAVDGAVGLAYAMRGFRGIAEEIQPLNLPELESTNSTSAERDATNSSQTNGGESSRRSSHAGAAQPSLKSHYSTLANKKVHGYCTPRFFTTSAESTPINDQNQSRDIDPSSYVSDPELLSNTVGDFLGAPNNFIRPQRIRGLLRAQKEAQNASQALEQALADGSLTPGESARLENIVSRNERRVAKTLALRSADDLRAMLDKGQVDFRRAQWLESSIEKGQAILLEEARQIRQMLDEKTISPEQFQVVREKLEQQNQILTAEATRLRQMVDEESEGGGRGSDRGAFDGFQGNV